MPTRQILPNFLIIGVAKAGTTALYHLLVAHPQVFMSPVKEPQFFHFEGASPEAVRYRNKVTITTLAAYHALFDGVRDELAIGEASPSYIHSSTAPDRIRHHIPQARLVVMLRQPVERAYSQYAMMMHTGNLPYRPFEDVFREMIPVVDTWGEMPKRCFGFGHSFYHDNLQRYYQRFDTAQIRVYLYDDFIAQPATVLRDLYGFLGIDATFEQPVERRYNVSSGMPRIPSVHALVMKPNPIKAMAQQVVPKGIRRRLAGWIHGALRTPKAALSPEDRQAFTEVYREDILKTQDLIGQDLSHWFS